MEVVTTYSKQISCVFKFKCPAGGCVMTHSKWCGKPCGECEERCQEDELKSVCHLDCEYLDPLTDQPNSEECHYCDTYPIYCTIMGWELERHI